ncbi:biotin carboxylase [Streptacidiphilus sp. MAP12-33]|uniref:ATP-grasp domain-containing protein n=1 Tax=Streptacidiphilus sp. MAP12-33 TaxID=3156266 RepID=UPI00351820AA
MSEHVLVVGTGRDFPARIRGLRSGTRTTVICDVAYVGRVADPGGNHRVIGVRGDAPMQEWVDLAAAVHRSDPFTRIGSFGERDQHPYAAIGQALGLTAHSRDTVALAHDKEAMRRRLRERGVDATASARVEDVGALRSFVRDHGLPCIVKPVSSSGSAGVTKVCSEGELDAAFASAGGSYLGIDNPGVLVEEFLEGPQFSVEAFSEAGEHQVVGITGKYSDPRTYVELGHVTPAELPAGQREEIEDHLVRVLDALGVEFGPTHTEIVLTEQGPRLIETHVRMGGDRIPELTRDVTGVDIDDCAARQTLGEKVLPDIRTQLTASARTEKASAIWFSAIDASGILEAIHGLEAARQLPAVTEVVPLTSEGAQVGAPTTSESRLAYARALSDTPQAAVAAARQATESLEFQLRVRPREPRTI